MTINQKGDFPMSTELYIYDEGRVIIAPKEHWLDWFEMNGDKENFLNGEEWFSEMVSMHILNKAFEYHTMSKELKLLDSIEEIRQKVVEQPAQYPIDYTIRLITAIVAQYIGYESRCDWTDELKQYPQSNYFRRLKENRFHL